ncbi:disulfide bond formation protein DsbB [Bathymodiolus platifrons methanotrophic gill symbiont]|uniref:disulfide bond formation protein B n=1 Tax=Bathymodiolus platifrons methanotrophic gill symbiont TaxID=113268 RepID=UPI000B41D40A|nr:disulfide bond formation protein B [Bathymodiolus platifrons methanotrophic gill symbiont]MCK5871030.1 disulfide bond formation protein B [Methyloprofundus sp.]TXK96610.1 disulfide bond formation protein B [Methylococcaceae bacterium CS4]TXK99873.1 disulfide bond formation protein B [Methylococcaceae bacterium CS5]TXL06500.1 disulfide bond formation protein B [Methylococcaceae bacterium CS1]TXL07260.1 disulfide bond formation protein B [Methylococcaceae bacterium CS3]TXL10835.1 disulfide b
MIQFKARTWFFLGFLSCFSMLAVGAYFQFVEEMEPCPLCISQRIAILIAGVTFFIAAVHNPAQKGIQRYAILGAIFALAGSAISARHVWLQNLPADEVPECSPGLSYIFENFPLTETLKLMLSGTGECADVLWTLFGLSIPGWTFLAFIGLAALSLYQLINKAQ